MANFDQLKQSVANVIKTNGAEEITGAIMQDVLLTIINSIAGGYMFGGAAQHSGNVGNPDYNVFYLAGSGAYTGYGNPISIPDGCYGVFRYNGEWTQEVLDIGVHLTGQIAEGETNGVTGGVINAALQTLFNNVMDILDSMEFTYNTPSAQQATKAMLDVIVTLSGGSRVLTTLTLAAATISAAGLMSAEDKQKVDRILSDIRSLSFSDTTAAEDEEMKIVQTLSATLGDNPETISTFQILAATASKAGLLSAADKAKLDALWSSGYQFAGFATPSTTPVSTTSKIFYIATEAGTYFNAVTVTQGINLLSWDGTSWSAVQVVDIPILTDDNIPMSDFSIADENSNTLAIFSGGDFRTKNFDTKKTPKQEEGDEDVDLSISDEQGNSLMILACGNIKTKNFDSKKVAMFGKDYDDADFAIADADGNILAVFANGGFRTKNFDTRFSDTIHKFKGKRIAIIGDSISTFQGWLPSDISGYDGNTYARYYPRGDVNTPNVTWWYRMMDKLLLTPNDDNINVCAWSGSRVTGDSNSTTNAYAACSDRRISDIAIRGWEPDIIIIWISCNDWGNDIPIGTWKISDSIPQEGTITEMRAAYALMLYKVHNAYPNARIFCCTNLDDRLRDRVDGWPSDNRNGVTTTQWNDNIREIADAFGCDVIDIHACGINYSNLPTLVVDTGLHPNAAGMEMIANKVVAELIAKY